MNLKTLTQLISHYTAPVAPPKNYPPALDTVRLRFVRDTSITQEIFKRPEDTDGFRYCGWVAWSDAGGTIRDHSWHTLPGIEALVTDTVLSAGRHVRRIGCHSSWRHERISMDRGVGTCQQQGGKTWAMVVARFAPGLQTPSYPRCAAGCLVQVREPGEFRLKIMSLHLLKFLQVVIP